MLTNVGIFNQYVFQTSAILRRAVALKRTACYALRANHCIHANSNQSSAAMLSINVPLHNKLAALDLELPENFPKSQPYVASWGHGTT